MTKLLTLRWGVADDPTALQPTLKDCLDPVLAQSSLLLRQVIERLVVSSAPQARQASPALQQPGVRESVMALAAQARAAGEFFQAELTRLAYEGGGKEQAPAQALRFDDLQLFGDAELDQSIEVARAQQAVMIAVEDVLPDFDALVSTLMGWRSTQPGLNPLRPDVFVRALQATLAASLPEAQARERLIVPVAGQLGVRLRGVYRELVEWLTSCGVGPAVPVGGRKPKNKAGAASPVSRSVAKTLLTLERLRKLLAGDFDPQAARAGFLHTVPASMALLQDMNQVDKLVERLEQERPSREPSPSAELPPDRLAERESTTPSGADEPKLGRQLGEQVVRLMFDNLARDHRLVGAYQQQLRAIEPAVRQLARQDSRFFSDRNHPARQLLERMTQRSLAFAAESDEGWQRFLGSIESGVRWLDGKPAEAETFRELLTRLQDEWAGQEHALRQRREDAARTLVRAEQRNLLAQKLAAGFDATLATAPVPDFVADFLKDAWSHVVAQAKLSCLDGSDDPYGDLLLVDDLLWSVQDGPALRGRLQRLAQMVPALVRHLRDGLRRIDYPPELAERFFDRLAAIHAAALKDGREAARRAAEAAEATGQGGASEFGASGFPDDPVWLARHEAQEAGYLGPESVQHDSELPPEGDEDAARAPAAVDAAQSDSGDLAIGTWVELQVQGVWLRVQLTWASPHQTLFMFTSPSGTAHSMSRRTLDRLRGQGHLRVVAGRNLVDEALDEVARTALLNSLDDGKA